MKRSLVTHLFVALLIIPSVLASQAGDYQEAKGEQNVLIALQGKWHFDLYSGGRTVPVASGQREMRLLADSTKLAWTETPLDQPQVGRSFLGYWTETHLGQLHAGTGLLGYNAVTGTWYVLGAYTHEPNPLVLLGRADRSGRTLVFNPLETTSGPGTFVSSELRLVDADHFEWVASDGRWRAVFTRIDHS